MAESSNTCLRCDEPIVVDWPMGPWDGTPATSPARFLCGRCARESAEPIDDDSISYLGEIFLRFGPYFAHTDDPRKQYLYE